jgi:hypothetical protein
VYIPEQLLECRPVQAGSAEAAIIVAISQCVPAILLLAEYVGFGCLALRLKRIEILRESSFGRLAGCRWRSVLLLEAQSCRPFLHSCFRPKK